MNELKIRLLRADEIECRIGTISDTADRKVWLA